MEIGKLAFREYKTTSSYKSIKSIRNLLSKETFLVVIDKEIYQGIITLSDISVMGHNLVVDCIREKPCVDYSLNIEEAIKILEANSLHVAPVYKGNSFFSVIRYRDILNHLFEKTKKIAVNAEKIEKYEALKKLSSGVGHDFNNILTASIGNLDMAAESLDDKPEIKRDINKVIDILVSGRLLTEQLLTFSLEGSLNRERCDITKEIMRLVPFFTKGSKTEPVFSFSDQNLDKVMIDKKMFMQVWSNLTINSVQAMPEGGKIEFSGENLEIEDDNQHNIGPGRYIKISVHDNGPGIPESIKENIFEPYISSKPRGSGLGLSIVHSIVSLHKGSIKLDKKTEKGTKFDIYLPS